MNDRQEEPSAPSLSISHDEAIAILLDKSYDLIQSGEYSEAIEVLDQILAWSPNVIKALLRKVVALYRMKEYSKALAVDKQILEIEPNNQSALRYAVFAYTREGEFGEAYNAFGQVRESYFLEPRIPEVDNINILCELGYGLSTMKRLEEANEVFGRVIEHDLDNSYALANVGNNLCALGRLAEGIAYFDRALVSKSLDADLRAKVQNMKLKAMAATGELQEEEEHRRRTVRFQG